MSGAWSREPEWLDRVRRWISFHPVTGSQSARELATEIAFDLEQTGFAVRALSRPGHPPLLVASRPAPPGALTLGIYGHYDIEPAHEGWRSDARRLRVEDGRVYGRGIADNLGPLAQRLLAARDVRRWPGVLWVLEGEEETGSPMLAEHLADGKTTKVSLWLDETGYFETPNRQRILVARQDEMLAGLCDRLRDIAGSMSTGVVVENRMLNRASTASTNPVSNLFGDIPYTAFGPNDGLSNVHGADESLPLSTLLLSARQFVATLEYLALGARA
jgi:acetylornithine deacetylase/succinyl-diaminopimelate desuccinylase-like protein